MIENSPATKLRSVDVGSTSAAKKRKRNTTPTRMSKSTRVDLEDEENEALWGSPVKNRRTPRKARDEEKRLRVFRKHPPLSYIEKLNRATSQRMFVIERTRGGTDDVPEETVEIAGTTGNIYYTKIDKQPSCTCPDNQKGNQCKHIIYVLYNVLKAPEHLQYQLAFLSFELREIFAQAPAPVSSQASDSDPEHPSNRKEVSGDCPICFTDLETEGEELVWCKAACGQNLHKGCFEQWAKSQKGKEVRCVYCRTAWQGDDDSIAKIQKIKEKGRVNDEGYMNVAEELGLTGHRDYSTYHQPWVKRRFGYY